MIKFISSAILGLMFGFALTVLMGLTGCAHQNTRIGQCEIPPNQSEGYTLVACVAGINDFSTVKCVYAKVMPYGIEIRELVTKGCSGYEITNQGVIMP